MNNKVNVTVKNINDFVSSMIWGVMTGGEIFAYVLMRFKGASPIFFAKAMDLFNLWEYTREAPITVDLVEGEPEGRNITNKDIVKSRPTESDVLIGSGLFMLTEGDVTAGKNKFISAWQFIKDYEEDFLSNKELFLLHCMQETRIIREDLLRAIRFARARVTLSIDLGRSYEEIAKSLKELKSYLDKVMD